MAGTGKGRQKVNTLLLILIGFCVLAIIEILYGQAQMRVERERLALEEQNRQMVEELRKEWAKLQESSGVVTINEETGITGDEGEHDQIPAKTTDQLKSKRTDAAGNMTKKPEQKGEDNRNYDMQIVILGDSIMDGGAYAKRAVRLCELGFSLPAGCSKCHSGQY